MRGDRSRHLRLGIRLGVERVTDEYLSARHFVPLTIVILFETPRRASQIDFDLNRKTDMSRVFE